MQPLVASQQALEDLGNVPQVEQVVNLGGRGQELVHHRVVDVHGGLGHDVAERLELVVELLELAVDHGAEYAIDLVLLWEGHVDQVEARLQTLRDDGASSAGRSHGGHEQHVLDVLGRLLLAVVPEAEVEPQADELERRLRAVHVLGGHVEVVHEVEHAFAAKRHVHALGALLHTRLDDLLHVVR